MTIAPVRPGCKLGEKRYAIVAGPSIAGVPVGDTLFRLGEDQGTQAERGTLRERPLRTSQDPSPSPAGFSFWYPEESWNLPDEGP